MVCVSCHAKAHTVGRRLPMAYHFTILFPFVSMILRSTQATGHTARSKALTVLLQGLLRLKQASLSGMSRGVAVVYAEKSFRGQLKRAHRLMKNAQIDTWATGAALFAHMTQNLQQVGIAVDWTALGAFRVLEACQPFPLIISEPYDAHGSGACTQRFA